ncbi:MAG: hypothetical protein GXX79_14450 [Actinomycetales bacterium]|mgnify:CR=1 FL=1|nr:hypothetical protein [Actinomycetales bacterium]
MTTTTPAAAREQHVPLGGARLPAPPRDRRPALAALALLLIVAGALGSALVAYRSGHRVDVLVARVDIKPGQRISDSDLGVERVATDSGGVVLASARQNFVGTVATARIPAGTLVNRTMFLKGSAIPGDAVVVGAVLTTAQRPARALQPGNVVRVYLVGRNEVSGAAAAGTPGEVLLPAVRVVEVEAGTSRGSVAVSLLVPAGAARRVVPAAAAGQLALARLADDTVPAVDFRTG